MQKKPGKDGLAAAGYLLAWVHTKTQPENKNADEKEREAFNLKDFSR